MRRGSGCSWREIEVGWLNCVAQLGALAAVVDGIETPVITRDVLVLLLLVEHG